MENELRKAPYENGAVENHAAPDHDAMAPNGLTNGVPPDFSTSSNPDPGAAAPPRPHFKELFKANWHPVITYCSVFWSFGMCVAFLGPTLLDLGCLTATDMKSISWVFFAQLLFCLIGCVCGGYLVQKCAANIVLLVATAIIPFMMFLVPFAKVLPVLGLILAVMGLNMGAIDCLANLQMIQLFGQDVSPFLQAMHFFYGLGAFVSPMIAEPFLLNEDCTPLIDHINVTTPLPTTVPAAPGLGANFTLLPAETLEEAQSKTHVKYAFWIMAATQLPIPLLVFSLVMKEKCVWTRAKEPRLSEADNGGIALKSKKEYEDIDKQKENKPSIFDPQYMYHKRGRCFSSSTSQVIIITLLTALMLLLYDGVQSAYGGYVYSYAVKSIVDLNKTEGAYLNACFWGLFAVGRLFSIPIATKFSPAFMLLCNILGCSGAMILMLSLRHDHIALYIGTCFFGLFLSSVTPTSLSLAEQYIDVSSSITSFIVVSGGLGEMIFPVIVGNLFVVLGPVSFLVFCNCVCFYSLLVFGILWFIGRKTPKHKATNPGSFIWCRACCLRGASRELDYEEEGVAGQTSVKYYSRMVESSSDIELAPPHNQSSYTAAATADAAGFRESG